MAETPGHPQRGETILVVDDEEWVRQLVGDVLCGLGYQVLRAADGLEGLDMSAEHDGPIHLVLTDVAMPRMRGPQMAERLLEHRPGVKIVYMSGYADEALPDTALLLPKPFTPKVLLSRVREILDENRGHHTN